MGVYARIAPQDHKTGKWLLTGTTGRVLRMGDGCVDAQQKDRRKCWEIDHEVILTMRLGPDSPALFSCTLVFSVDDTKIIEGLRDPAK